MEDEAIESGLRTAFGSQMLLVALLALFVVAPASSSPVFFHGCVSDIARALPYCDTSLSYEARAEWLVTNMSLLEKVRTCIQRGS